MALPSASNQTDDDSTLRSTFRMAAYLEDWWLETYEDDSKRKRLSVGGVTSRDNQAVRVFHFAPIRKRYDVLTLETVDGIFLKFNGFINKARTEENGFPPEVFDHFVFGFPPHWEELSAKWLERQFTTEVVSRSPIAIGLDNSSVHLEEHKATTIMGDFTPGLPKKSGRNSEKVYDASDNSGICDSEAAVLEKEQCKTGTMNSGVEHFEKRVSEIGKEGIHARLDTEIHESTGGRVASILKAFLVDSSRQNFGPGFCSGDPMQGQNSEANVQTGDLKRKIKTAQFSTSLSEMELKSSGFQNEISTECTPMKKTKRNLKHEGPVTHKKSKKNSLVSPESLSFKRSRSGRLLLPTMEFWRNQMAIYDTDRQITGITSPAASTPVTGKGHEPRRKRR